MTRQIMKLIFKWTVAEFANDGELETAHVLDGMAGVFHEPDTNEWTRTERIVLDLFFDVVFLVPFLWIAAIGALVYGIWVLYYNADELWQYWKFKMWLRRHR